MTRVKNNYMKIIKISLGSLLAFVTASIFQLDYAISASIITILTIQDTKKETLTVALNRFGSFFLAMVSALIIFTSLGYTPFTFGLFVLVFTFLCYLFNVQDSLSSNVVLTTHLYLGKSITLAILLNEFYLLMIGMSIGVILNLYIPRDINSIKENQSKIDDKIKEILISLSALMIKEEQDKEIEKIFNELNQLLEITVFKSIQDLNNSLWKDTSYYLSYVEMRKAQSLNLVHLYDQIKLLNLTVKQTYPIANYVKAVATSFHEHNNALDLLHQLDELKEFYKKEELPKTRIEFENRALLYYMLNELEDFLVLKRDFMQELTHQQIELYW